MSSGGKGGGAGRQPSYDYFGTVAGVVRVGRCDVLLSVEVDGKAIWTGSLARGAEDYVDLTSAIDASNFLPGGYCRFYWGTATQAADAFLADMGHPPYRGYAYIVLRHFLFGRERNTARDVKVKAAAKPLADVSLVAAEHNVIDDGQINPVAAIVEWLTAPYGLGYPLATFKADTWLAAGAYAYNNRALTFCSPLVTSFEPAKNILQDLGEMLDLRVRWTKDGLLEAVLLKHGETPGDVLTLDARHFTQGRRPRLRASSFDEVPTSARIAFVDREKLFKETTEEIPHAWAYQHRRVRDPLTLSRPHVTRRAQAAAIATRALTRTDQPSAPVEGDCRGPIAKNLLPGDKVLIDVDPEPGGGAVAQLCIIEEVSAERSGPVKIRARTDTLSPSVPYAPAWAATSPQDAEALPIAHALIVPLPPAGFSLPLSCAILATRSQRDLVGFHVFFDRTSGGDFPELGQQTGFAVRGSLAANYDEAATTLRVNLLDGADGPDAELAGRTPESETAARADFLLLIMANVDGDGRIALDADGRPELEFVSVIGRTAVDADTHDYTVLRGRRGLPVRAWTTDAQAWIVPIGNITAWRHPDLLSLLTSQAVGYFRLASYNAITEDDGTPPQFTFKIPLAYDVAPRLAWTSPAGSTGETDAAGDITIEFTATDRQGDLISLRVESRRWDGAAWVNETVHLDVSFAPTSHDARVLPLNFPGHATEYRAFQLTVIARDRAGNQTVEQRTITRVPTGVPSTPPPPTFNPVGDTYIDGYDTVTITAVSPATEIHWSVSSLGTPSAPPTYNTHAGLSVGIGTFGNQRLWARASDGANHSPWAVADYYRLTNGGGGPIEP